MNYYNMDVSEVMEKLNTSKQGLSNKKAQSLLSKNGYNVLPTKKRTSFGKIFLRQFGNPIELILVLTVFLAFLAKEFIDAIALIFIILIDVLMGAIEEWKTMKSSESLLNMIKAQTKVIRDNKEIVIDASEVVVGDIIVLESGDKISADARLIECHNLEVDESPLTGESLGAFKMKEKIDEDVALMERCNMVYAGTCVLTGRAKAVVVGTAMQTEIGKIVDKVASTKEEKSPLTIRIEKFSRQISILILVIAFITTIILIYKGYAASTIFLSVIALSVSAMPEGLPLALTLALTIASKKMAKKNVIVKNLNSVESLGSCTVIATDKTGTLTVDEQTAKKIVTAKGEIFDITGEGYNNKGKVIPLSNADINKAKEIAYLGMINNEAHLEYKNGKWDFYGDSIDIAFLSLAQKLEVNEHPSVIETIPYESQNGYSALFYEKNHSLYCTVKGSLEHVLKFSKEKDAYYKQNEELTKMGYRVIAIADGKVNGTLKSDIHDLEFKGLVAFIDPIRKEVKPTIKECLNSQIKVVMITGDHPNTAFAISKELGLCTDISEVATGQELSTYRNLGEKEFDDFVRQVKVFSRVSPLDKLDIVNSLKRQGEFVALTGDGVNDAPAMKSANIGVAMGSGTDVAKETASLIITDNNFVSIVEGIKEGRIAYNNIRKIVLFLLSCGLAEILYFLLSIFFGYDIPLVAIQLLWLNIVTDGLQDMALSFDGDGDKVMKCQPRNPHESLFSRDLKVEVAILGISIGLIVFILWKRLMDFNIPLVRARAIIMMLMVFMQNLNVLNCRSEKNSIFKVPLDNPFIILTVLGSIILQIVVSVIPITATFLKITLVPFHIVIRMLGLSLSIIVIFEIYKLIYRIVKNK